MDIRILPLVAGLILAAITIGVTAGARAPGNVLDEVGMETMRRPTG